MNKKETAFRVIVPILSISLLIVVLELFARLYFTGFVLPMSYEDFRKKQPAPYQDAPYFSQEFIAESFEQPGGWQFPEGTRLIIPNDYKGKFFNVVNGRRMTAFQPEKYENTVYLFGGSTIYNSEVPDSLTIASQLQRLLKRNYGDRYVVRNYGTTTVTITQQLERLRALLLEPGDIIVFYDGVNDIYQGLFYADPDETMIETNRRTVGKMSFLQKFILSVHKRFSGTIAIVGLFLDPVDRDLPPHLSDSAFMHELLVSMKYRYKKAIEEAHDYSNQSGALFIHFLQPHLFADNRFTEYEKELYQNFYIVHRGMDVVFERGYPELETAIRELPGFINSYDLTGIFNDRPENVEYFLDTCHVNHEGNKIIAENIFNALQEIISTDDQSGPSVNAFLPLVSYQQGRI